MRVSAVIASQDSNKSDTRHDAKDEGRNKYYNNRIIKKEEPEDGVVIKKHPGGFSMTV